MKFCIENINDIDKYFRGTFVKFMGMRGVFQDGADAGPAEELVHSIDQISGNLIKGKRFENGETIPYQFFLYSEEDVPAPEVEFILPKKSYFNTENGACLLQRNPARQYRRGICGDNTSIVMLFDFGFDNMSVNLEILNKYVQKQAFYNFQHRGKSYAVSRRMAVDPSGLIFVDQTKIGSINYATGEITALPIFHPEIEQVLKQHAQSNIKLLPPVTKAKKKKGKAALMEHLANIQEIAQHG